MRDISRTELENLIDEWIVGKNAIRDRAIMKDRLIDGLTYERLAEKYDMSVRQIRNIVKANEPKILRHMS